jgi:NFU1 iron-sulfur cluster scaffold homolog, mitochondrial
MSEEIKIQAQVLSQEVCQFTVDRPVYSEGAVFFPDRKRAEGSPLAEKLFELPNIVSVLIHDTLVKVTKSDGEDWLPTARQIGGIIRAQIQSAEKPISDTIEQNLPSEEEIRSGVKELIDSQINPAVASHGGFVELVDVRKNNVYLQLGGGCHGCGMANVTLRQGIEKMIRQSIPQVGSILDVTDHESGTNPYYAPAQQ